MFCRFSKNNFSKKNKFKHLEFRNTNTLAIDQQLIRNFAYRKEKMRETYTQCVRLDSGANIVLHID